MEHLHVVARARRGCSPLSASPNAWLMWARLQAAFPDALAACLMPNHVHVIVKGMTPEAAKRTLAIALRGLSRIAGTGGLWEPVPPPALIPDRKHLLRQIRYVHLNPCRDGLTPDPLCWPWSTHRGLAGAEYRPWVKPRLLARELGVSHTGFVEWFHGYVSADPSVALRGTPLPRADARGARLEASPRAVRDAVLSAAPLAARSTLRTGFILLSRAQGFRDHGVLSRALGITHQHALRLARRRDDALVQAATVCLGDDRLRRHASAAPQAGIFTF